jgi:acyl-coenzyme A synthetase/AMP-(fatty) acid ligase
LIADSTLTPVSIPELLTENLDLDFCITSKGAISRRQLLAHALALSQQLPENSYAINLCQSRYWFIVAYLAVIFRNQVNLLPANQSPKTIQNLLSAYPGSYCIVDSSDVASEAYHFAVSAAAGFTGSDCFILPDEISPLASHLLPLIDTGRTISISFTSGSTGESKAIEKNWREFQRSAELALQQLNLNKLTATLISTVPTQHMYGLETSLFWPLFSRLSIHDSRPFYPQDIQTSLASLPQPGVLISTPTHLKACNKTQIAWPAVKLLLSSTAPLSLALARHMEFRFNAPLYELFGSTETLSFASRRTAMSTNWQTYQSIRLTECNHHSWVSGGHLMQPVKLDDQLMLHDERSFSILGRSNDIIKIAGKRASLTELNLILNEIKGIEDGLLFPLKTGRLAALVVSDLAKKTILSELKQATDPAFLPRIIFYVSAIPRTAMGKLNQAELQNLIQGLTLV